ncbi:hypothetical protein ESZ53_03995 [Salinibacterium sp. UTAS2018]|nr:hypothetical protein ESZ53_03995 [Salinibacterium sp. UTAS2018]
MNYGLAKKRRTNRRRAPRLRPLRLRLLPPRLRKHRPRKHRPRKHRPRKHRPRRHRPRRWCRANRPHARPRQARSRQLSLPRRQQLRLRRHLSTLLRSFPWRARPRLRPHRVLRRPPGCQQHPLLSFPHSRQHQRRDQASPI